MEIPAGWLTDIAVLRLRGAQIADRGDHLVIRSPDNAAYHWGNFLLVTDPEARDDAARWVERFRATFPDAHHMGIGLPTHAAGRRSGRRGRIGSGPYSAGMSG